MRNTLQATALYYFREVVRRGSARKAAAALNVAASALNRQILNLEADLGTKLFDRTADGMRLTVAGELLHQHVVRSFYDLDRVRGEIDALNAAQSGHINIVALDSLLVDFLPRSIERFRDDFPAVDFSVVTVQPTDVMLEVAEGRGDIGFTFVSQIPTTVRFIAQMSAPIGVVMPADHPLASEESITFEDASRFPVLTQTGPIPRSADIDPDFAAFKAKIKPKIVSNSILMLKTALRLNLGISFFTRLGFIREIEQGELVWRPFRSPAINQLQVGMMVSSSRVLSPPALQLTRRIAEDMRVLSQKAA